MKVFDHPNKEGFLCPICKTASDMPVVLVGVLGSGNSEVIEAKQYHLACLDLVETERTGIVFLLQAVPR